VGSRTIRRLAVPAALGVLLGAVPPALANVAFTPPRDVPLNVDPGSLGLGPSALVVIGPGVATDPAAGAGTPVQRVAVIAGSPAAVRVVALGPDGPVGPPSDVALPAGASPTAITAADLDGDGRRELVVASGPTATLSVVQVPDAAGPLSTRTDLSAGTPGKPVPGFGAVLATDLNGDGHPDLVTGRGYGLDPDDGYVALTGDGAGGFGPPVLVASPGAAGGFGDSGPLLSADVNGDGRPDLLLGGILTGVKPGQSFGALRVFITAPDGTLIPLGTPFPGEPTWSLVDSVRLADLDGDGTSDIAFLDGDTPVVRSGDGQGGFGPAVTLPASAAPARGLALGDVDGDGRPDLLVLTAASPTAAVLDIRLDLGGGRFADPVRAPLPAATALAETVDLNGDGAPDLVLGQGSRPDTIAVAYAVPSLSGGPLDFGERTIGQGGPQREVEVANTGVAPARISSVALAGAAAGDFAIQGDGCSGRTLAAGQRCPLIVGFTPAAAGGRQATARLTAQDGVVADLALTGVGAAPPPVTPALPAARVSCPLRRPLARGARIGCTVRFTPGGGVRVALRLLARKRVVARADLRRPGTASLRVLRRLAPGRYTLVIVVGDGARSRQTRRPVVLRRH